MLIIIGICIVNGIYPSIHIVQLLIYVPLTFFFTASVALFTSTLGIIVRDTQMIMQALLRILFYMSPILWVPKDSGIGGTIGEIIKFNPVYFLAESYRAAILFHEWYFIEHWKLLLYNVIVILIFFVLGSILHRRYRDHFRFLIILKSLINVEAFIKDFVYSVHRVVLIYNFYIENMRGKRMRLIIKSIYVDDCIIELHFKGKSVDKQRITVLMTFPEDVMPIINDLDSKGYNITVIAKVEEQYRLEHLNHITFIPAGNKHIVKHIRALSRSKVIVIDTYYLMLGGYSKKHSQTIIQTWHASGALKISV